MARSISIVEYKVKQAHFFLTKIAQTELSVFEIQCFVDAFTITARSITFSMQAALSDVQGFTEWYKDQQRSMKADPLSRFFHQYRTVITHIGDTVVRAGATDQEGGRRVLKYYFMPIPDLPNVPKQDVLSICRHHFIVLLQLVYNLFDVFLYQLDDRWYYTQENFARLGKTIEDAEQELGFPRGWTSIGEVFSESERWSVLRHTQTIGCQLSDLFLHYLGKQIEGPDCNMEQEDKQA